MGAKNIIVTGGDAGFFSYIRQCIASLIALDIQQSCTLGVLDLGLLPSQKAELEALGCRLATPVWDMPFAQPANAAQILADVGRMSLRTYFPDHETYIWFDADAWAQTLEFYDRFTIGVAERGAAVTREDGFRYRRGFAYAKWWYGNMILAYGAVDGVRIARKPAVNNGLFAFSHSAPHWESWRHHYLRYVRKTGKLTNQHAFNAMLELDKLPLSVASARCNWIPALSRPSWNAQPQQLCEPDAAALPLSVVHLAGPDKAKRHELHQVGGGKIETALTYEAIATLRRNYQAQTH